MSIKQAYTVDTKIEFKANKCSFVRGNDINTKKEKMAIQLEQIWQETQSIAALESKDTSAIDFTSINQQKVKEELSKIEELLEINLHQKSCHKHKKN